MTKSDIINAVCTTFEESWQDIITKGRSQRFTVPRMVAAYLMRKELGMSVEHIATVIHRHHSILPYYVRTVQSRIELPTKNDQPFIARFGLVIYHLKMKAA